MASSSRENTASGMGLPLWARFTLLMTLALTIVIFFAGYALYSNGSDVARRAQDAIVVQGVELSGQFAQAKADVTAIEAELAGLKKLDETLKASSLRLTPEMIDLRERFHKVAEERTRDLGAAIQRRDSVWQRPNAEETPLGDGAAVRYAIKYGPKLEHDGFLYTSRTKDKAGYDLFVPSAIDTAEQGLLRLIVQLGALVVLVGAAMSVFIALQVSGPLVEIVKDVHQISRGYLEHRVRGGSGKEVRLLAHAINRMTKDLSDARETEVELQVREREVEVAGEVRQALLPQTTPKVPGFDLGADHIGSPELGGDFHDFIEIGDGRVGLLVCEVSGKGLPAALVGATARGYLRAELGAGGDVTEALQEVNRQLARDVRRGAAVTAMYALVDPAQGIATVACAGHKIPLIRYSAADKKVRTVQPEGIALGFDKGPVFNSRLHVEHVPIDPGDRLVVVNSGAVAIVDANGAELGEKPLYAHVMRHGAHTSAEFLERVRSALESYADGSALPRDVSIVTIARS